MWYGIAFVALLHYAILVRVIVLRFLPFAFGAAAVAYWV